MFGAAFGRIFRALDNRRDAAAVRLTAGRQSCLHILRFALAPLAFAFLLLGCNNRAASSSICGAATPVPSVRLGGRFEPIAVPWSPCRKFLSIGWSITTDAAREAPLFKLRQLRSVISGQFICQGAIATVHDKKVVPLVPVPEGLSAGFAPNQVAVDGHGVAYAIEVEQRPSSNWKARARIVNVVKRTSEDPLRERR